MSEGYQVCGLEAETSVLSTLSFCFLLFVMASWQMLEANLLLHPRPFRFICIFFFLNYATHDTRSNLISIGQTGRPCPIKCKNLWAKEKTLSRSDAAMGI